MSEDRFRASVSETAGPIRTADDGEASPHLDVTIRHAGKQYAGDLVSRDPLGAETKRSVAGSTCGEVSRALALFVALALERPPPVASLVAASVDAPASDPPNDAAPEPPQAEPAEPDEIVERSAGSHLLDQPVSHAGLSAFGSFTSAFGLERAFGAYAELQHDAPAEFSPAARVGFELAHASVNARPPSSTGWSSLSGTLDVARVVARIDACPLRTVGAVRWSRDASSIALCARGDVGTLTTTFATASSIRTWLATGAVAQVRWSSSRVFLGLELGITVPIARDAYYAQPGVRAFQTPPAVFTLAIGGGAYVL